MGETVWSANRPWMCEAHAAAAHETAAEALASEPAADSMPAEAATGVPTTEAAAGHHPRALQRCRSRLR